jgi:two-component system, OmpR family, phosphate regulon sensor histidine kinase PhoR
MKSPSPNNLLLIGSASITIIFTLIISVVFLVITDLSSTHLLLISILLVFFISHSIYYFIMKRYIDERIKPIYKNIHSLKVPREIKQSKSIYLGEDPIKKADEDVAVWAEQQKKEIDELKKTETYRREFLGDVSHELKTPIFNIQGYILTLLDGAMEDSSVNKEYLKKAEKNIDRMIMIVKDLEIISQLETGEIELTISMFDIIALSREIYEILEVKAKRKNIRLIFHDNIDIDSQVFVLADREKIRQVLTNLIENSINYGKEGGRTKLSFYDMDENILFEVSDNGIGIENKYIPRLFERFYRVDKSRSRNQGGSGLGLAIVKHIIESHQQTINVRSAPGVGSTFSFTLKKG